MGTRTRERFPVTIALLKRLIKVWRRPSKTVTARNCLRLIIIAINGCYRLGELAANKSNSFIAPARQQLSFTSDCLYTLLLLLSKTDPFGAGTKTYIAKNSSPTCAFTACANLEFVNPMPNAPLFQNAKGCPLTSSTVIAYLKKSLKCLNISSVGFSGHSFRKGGCQTLVEVGASEADIKAIGRWTSDCWKLYCTWPPERFVALSKLCASHN